MLPRELRSSWTPWWSPAGGPSAWYSQNYTPVQSCPVGQTASASSPVELHLHQLCPERHAVCEPGRIKKASNTGTDSYAQQVHRLLVPAADMNSAVDPSWQPGQLAPDGERDSSRTASGRASTARPTSTGQRNNGNGVIHADALCVVEFHDPGGRVPVADHGVQALRHRRHPDDQRVLRRPEPTNVQAPFSGT